MNEKIENFARQEIKNGLSKLPESNQLMFKRMYNKGNLNTDINEVVDNMPEEKLDWALQQVERTLNNLQNRN